MKKLFLLFGSLLITAITLHTKATVTYTVTEYKASTLKFDRKLNFSTGNIKLDLVFGFWNPISSFTTYLKNNYVGKLQPDEFHQILVGLAMGDPNAEIYWNNPAQVRNELREIIKYHKNVATLSDPEMAGVIQNEMTPKIAPTDLYANYKIAMMSKNGGPCSWWKREPRPNEFVLVMNDYLGEEQVVISGTCGNPIISDLPDDPRDYDPIPTQRDLPLQRVEPRSNGISITNTNTNTFPGSTNIQPAQGYQQPVRTKPNWAEVGGLILGGVNVYLNARTLSRLNGNYGYSYQQPSYNRYPRQLRQRDLRWSLPSHNSPQPKRYNVSTLGNPTNSENRGYTTLRRR